MVQLNAVEGMHWQQSPFCPANLNKPKRVSGICGFVHLFISSRPSSDFRGVHFGPQAGTFFPVLVFGSNTRVQTLLRLRVPVGRDAPWKVWLHV